MTSLIDRAQSKLHNFFFDTINRVDTGGRIETDDLCLPPGATGYQATGVREFRGLIKALPASARAGTFVDLGCGKGRTLLLARKYFSGGLGVEADDKLALIAMANLGLDRSWKVQCRDVRTFRPAGNETLFYMYNPFDRDLMEQVAQRIAESIRMKPRTAWVVYNNAVHDEVFSMHPSFDQHPNIDAGNDSFAVWRCQWMS